MCGFAGYINLNNHKSFSNEIILKMIQIQKHRGPDDSGVIGFNHNGDSITNLSNDKIESYTNGFNCIFGFNRLSIQDLSSAGHQPMLDASAKVMILLNGEIYNANDFRSNLETKGHKFRSRTDTEVVLNLYLEFGFDKMIQLLNGMFSIVIADLRSNEIYFCRDRFGIKPLYFYNNGSTFSFASELKSFYCLPDFKFELKESLLDEFLIFRNSINQTLFKNIENIEPGEYVILSSGNFKKKRFFNIDTYQRVKNNQISFKDAFDGLENCLDESVERQLISDVKVGCQLSGGVDSSLVTYFASNKMKKGSLETISIIFDDKKYSEEPFVDHVGKELSLIQHKYTLKTDYYFNQLENVSWHLESPVNHPNSIGIYLLSQRAKENVTVLLSGEGADETFGGYPRFSSALRPYFSKMFLSSINRNKKDLFGYLKYYTDPSLRAPLFSSYMQPGIAKMLKPDFNFDAAIAQRRDKYNQLTGNSFDKQVKYEIQTYLPDLLMRQDKMSMAHSIENRVPFLDNKVLDYSFNIPANFLISDSFNPHNKEKLLLKEICAKKFGKSFAFRNKMGFGIPLREFIFSFMKNKAFKEKLILSIKQRQLFNGKLIENWFNNIATINSHQLDALWTMLSFEIWIQKFENHENSHSN
ncbi:MAG: asparagine synthase (glutamine-hydrolyzing) [Bacteroidia bacterium]|nr:asparagine synthase (glutamine-hydrolyzing) [Bacteroidia bacterium]